MHAHPNNTEWLPLSDLIKRAISRSISYVLDLDGAALFSKVQGKVCVVEY